MLIVSNCRKKPKHFMEKRKGLTRELSHANLWRKTTGLLWMISTHTRFKLLSLNSQSSMNSC
uniref:Uncharacterized protein n=1 Tax=Rhizophora mucronata TaxID=61149 RepID=A0A2P2QAW8_RHIMU